MINDLHEKMHTLGYDIELSKISTDSTIIRFNKDGKKNAWLVAHQNTTIKGDPYVVAEFGDWKTGEKEKYVSTVKMTAHDKVAMKNTILKNSEKIRKEKERLQSEAAVTASEFWATCQDNPNSEYLKKKNISKLYGAKTTMTMAGRALVVPYFDVDGKLWGYQTIDKDGNKRFGAGQKKQGNFFVVPFLDALIDQSTIYIAEGFATAASIHEATGFAVAVAFDCGNIKHVAKNIKTKYNDKAVIICADADEVGLLEAKKAADISLAKIIVPKFKKVRPGQSDFNDLATIEGLDEVKSQVMGVKPEIQNVTCLGYDDETYYFITSSKAKVTPVGRGGFTKHTLLDLMPIEYWESRFPKSVENASLDLDRAVDTLMRTCRAVGIFTPVNVRGSGVWRDHNKTVVNVGDSLWIDGAFKPLLENKSKYIYQNSRRLSPPREDFASSEQMQAFYELLKRLSWKHESYPMLLLGWLMVAPICGALRWRPHIWITGGSGSGKTTVMENIIGKILEGQCFRFMGRSTEAGIRQQVGCNALPILFDENENTGKGSGQRVGSVVELFRQASSEGESQVVKGSAGGKAIAFNVRFVAAVSSITVSLTNEQDVNRFSILELEENKNNGFNDIGGTSDQLELMLNEVFCKEFTSRSVFKVDLIRENFKVFYKALQKKINARFADQYGTLIAGYYAAIKDQPVTLNDAIDLIENHIDLGLQVSDTELREEDACLGYLMNKIVRHGQESHTIASIISKIQDGNEGHTYFSELLEKYGMKYNDGFLDVQVKNPELRALFRDSAWVDGWARPLARLDGVEKNKVVRFNGRNAKCIRILLPK